MRQNPQITDGLLGQAVEGKVQELPCKTKKGQEKQRVTTRPKHRGAGYAPSSLPGNHIITCGSQAHALSSLSPCGAAQTPPRPLPIPPVTLFMFPLEGCPSLGMGILAPEGHLKAASL